MPGALRSDKEAVDDLTQEFLAESLEGLDRMDQALTALESQPADSELLAEIFRTVHTIKGTTGFLGFRRLEKLAHAGEHLLGALRDGHLAADARLINGLLQLMDGLRAILSLIEQTGEEGHRREDQDDELIALMETLRTGQPISIAAAPKKGASVAAESATPAAVAAESDGAATPASPEKTLRIDVDVLNRMVNLVGELVLTRNQLLRSTVDARNFAELTRRLDSVTGDLREVVMQARMQPVGQLFGKFPRLVRDLAQACEKEVRLEFSGQQTGLDKSLLEAIKDPLTHALRNAIDHGIERPAARTLAGKPAEGTVCLRASQQNGFVVIEIEDDGAGISAERVRAKALERGLITAERAAGSTEAELQQLIFLPGFSTAAALSHVSGRGVGMDVVKSNVERVGGTVELQSVAGKGTLLRMRVPLTLAIVPALVVESGGQQFCLPQTSLAELVCVTRDEADLLVQQIGNASLFRLRESLLPMVWLDDLLGLAKDHAEACANGFYLAVLETEGGRFGLVLDDLVAPEEIVVKPLSSVLREIGLFSGATVLGNGSLALILDTQALAQRAGLQVAAKHKQAEAAAATSDNATRLESFLVFQQHGDPPEERRALPLAAVERIEVLPRSSVAFASGQVLLPYRGELLPIHEPVPAELEELVLLICRKGEGRLGILVKEVLDIAGGQPMKSQPQLALPRLASVNDHLVTLLEGFAPEPRRWKEVA